MSPVELEADCRRVRGLSKNVLEIIRHTQGDLEDLIPILREAAIYIESALWEIRHPIAAASCMKEAAE